MLFFFSLLRLFAVLLTLPHAVKLSAVIKCQVPIWAWCRTVSTWALAFLYNPHKKQENG